MLNTQPLNAGRTALFTEKVKIARHALHFAQNTPLYEENLHDEEISHHLQKAKEHTACVLALLQDKIEEDSVSRRFQTPKENA